MLTSKAAIPIRPLTRDAIRNVKNDLWADVVIGKRDFTEIAAREIVPYKVNEAGGVVVDRSVNPGRAYVWDSGNNRILGLDLAKCYSQSSPCAADIIIGQPSGSDYGACNRDSSFQTYPNRPRSSASTLCGVPESTQTTLEDKSFSNMFVDSQGNLYVADSQNHRVLKYIKPFTTDTVADEVWGQADFTGNRCNRTKEYNGNPPPPTDSSLCYLSDSTWGLGVALDNSGNLWIADGGNSRVLRFPLVNGAISKTADLVLGQTNFTTNGPGDTLNKMRSPLALRFDAAGKLYVADQSGNGRVLIFNPPFQTGMTAATTLGSNYIGGPLGMELDPAGQGLWIIDHSGKVQLYKPGQTTPVKTFSAPGNAGGSIGIDAEGGLLTSSYQQSDVYRFLNGSLVKSFFSPPFGYNLSSTRRLEEPAWVGMTVTDSQLVIADGRLLFWNNLQTLSNGKSPDGSLMPPTGTGFVQTKTDAANRIWVTIGQKIFVYNSPLTSTSQPIKTIQSPLNVLGGGQIILDNSWYATRGLAPTPDGQYLWVSQLDKHRVLRIRNPLTDNPIVDIILGQTSLTGDKCNRDEILPPNSGTDKIADLTMLCFPGALALDKKGNLYVSDHFIESAGNWRQLMFAPSLFPAAPANVLYAPAASKEFPANRPPNPYTHMTWEPAFSSANLMVVGYNPYSGKRFVEYYLDPTKINPSNPRDYTYAAPDGQLNDFYSWPISAAFDKKDNLYVYDANRGQVRLYRQPFCASSCFAGSCPVGYGQTTGNCASGQKSCLPVACGTNFFSFSLTCGGGKFSYSAGSYPNFLGQHVVVSANESALANATSWGGNLSGSGITGPQFFFKEGRSYEFKGEVFDSYNASVYRQSQTLACTASPTPTTQPKPTIRSFPCGKIVCPSGSICFYGQCLSPRGFNR